MFCTVVAVVCFRFFVFVVFYMYSVCLVVRLRRGRWEFKIGAI